MMTKLTFCKIVNQIRELAAFNNKVIEVFDMSESPIDNIICMLSQALEEDTCAAWEDEMFEDLYDSKVSPEELYTNVVDYLVMNKVNARRLIYTLEDCIDNIFSSNSVVSINEKHVDEDGIEYLQEIYRGMAHAIPKNLLGRNFVKIHSAVSDKAYDDRIFIEVDNEKI